MVLPRTWGNGGSYYIPLRINLLTRMIERELNRDMQAEFQLSVAEWRVLALACTRDHTSAADVSAAFEADPGQVSRAVAGMVKAGLLKREPAPHTRKTKTLTPTKHAREVFDVLHRRRQAYYASILGGLTADELAAFDRALTIIATRVDAQRAPTVEE